MSKGNCLVGCLGEVMRTDTVRLSARSLVGGEGKRRIRPLPPWLFVCARAFLAGRWLRDFRRKLRWRPARSFMRNRQLTHRQMRSKASCQKVACSPTWCAARLSFRRSLLSEAGSSATWVSQPNSTPVTAFNGSLGLNQLGN